jgi:hypothetical protein
MIASFQHPERRFAMQNDVGRVQSAQPLERGLLILAVLRDGPRGDMALGEIARLSRSARRSSGPRRRP